MQYRQVVKSSAVVGAFISLSRVFGLIRDMLLAAYFGTSLAKSAFDVAFQIPNLFRRLFGEGALSSSFIPVFTDALEKEGREKAWELAGRVMWMLAVVLGGIVIVGVAGFNVYLRIWHPGEKALLTLSLLRIMFPYAFFICFVALCMAILNSLHHFVVPAATPIILNLVLIAAVIWVCPLFGMEEERRIYGVAWAVLAAGVVQLIVQIPALRRHGLRWRFSWDWRDERVRKILGLMLPATIGTGVTQFNVAIDRILAMWAGPWGPAALTYAEHMVYLPLGVFATALGTVLLPVFSRQATRSLQGEMVETINNALRHLMFVMIPAAVGLIVVAHPVIRLLLERGSFTAESTLLTARALRFYAPGLLTFSLCKIYAPAFYSLKDMVTPVKVGICAIALNFVLNVTSVIVLPPYYKHAGIALGSVIAEGVNGVALALILRKRIGSPGWRRLFGTMWRIGVASGVMGLAVSCSLKFLALASSAMSLHGKVAQGFELIAGIAIGVVVYLALALMLCRNEAKEIKAALRRREPGLTAEEG